MASGDSEAYTPDDPTRVLFIDDDERWAGYLAAELTRFDPRLTVTVTVSPNEALQQLSGDAVDCVVALHKSSSLDAFELLDRVREIGRELPFVFVTPSRSDELVERAASDTAVEMLLVDGEESAELYAATIRSAVSGYRAKRRLAERTSQYETLADQTGDAVGIVQQETFVDWNRTLRDLSGYDDAQLNTMYPVWELFHPADRRELRNTVQRWDGREPYRYDTRLYTACEETRHCELHGRAIDYDGEPAMLLTIRDRTDRRNRTRRLEWETELTRTVQRTLVESSTREEMEDEICQQLHDYGYALAWTGRVTDEGRADPRAVAGDNSIGIGDGGVAADNGDDAPSVWAARLGEPQFVDDLTDLLEADWQQTALEAGFRSAGALPLVYEDVQYGVLAVYHTQFDQFTDTERSLLCSLADLQAFALHDVETRQALAANGRVGLELRVSGSYYLNDLAQHSQLRGDSPEFTVLGTARITDNRVRQYVTVDGVDGALFETLASDHPTVETASRISETGDLRFQIDVRQETPQSRLATLGAVVDASVVRVDGTTATIRLPNGTDISETVGHLRDSFEHVSTQAVGEAPLVRKTDGGTPSTMVETLTTKQENALAAAFHHGYFERPRQNTAKEIAATLDISHSTFLQHLRVAEQKLLSELFR